MSKKLLLQSMSLRREFKAAEADKQAGVAEQKATI